MIIPDFQYTTVDLKVIDMNKKILSALLTALVVALMLVLSNLLRLCLYKYSPVGTHGFHFSPINMTGSFGLWGLGSFIGLALYSLISLSTRSFFNAIVLMAHIPTFVSYAFWLHTAALVRVGIPLACMVLFLLNPVGCQAMAYSLFWLIPVALYPWSKKNVLACSFAATFTTHAVGSVLFVYCLPMTAAGFIALIPVVIVERTIFALGSYLVWHITQKAQSVITSTVQYHSKDYISYKG